MDYITNTQIHDDSPSWWVIPLTHKYMTTHLPGGAIPLTHKYMTTHLPGGVISLTHKYMTTHLPGGVIPLIHDDSPSWWGDTTNTQIHDD